MEKNKRSHNKIFSIELNDWSYWNISYAGLAILCCSIFVCPMTLVPQHDVIIFPEYWYEFMITTTCCVLTYWTILAMMRFKVFFQDIGFLVKPKTWISIFLAFSIGYNGLCSITYIIWTKHFGYYAPVPFTGSVPMFPMVLVVLIAQWFQFRLEDRVRPCTRRRIMAFLLYFVILTGACGERNVCTILMLVISTDIQPIMSIVMPILRELEAWLLHKVTNIAAGEENRDAKFLTIIEHNVNYTAFLAIALGQLATEATAYCILAVEFLLNMYKVFKIIKIGRKIQMDDLAQEESNSVQKELIDDMVVVEIVEIIMPIAYTISILMAYYGPNSEIMGNIGNDYWGYRKIENLGGLLAGLCKMFSLDVFSFILGSALIWKFSSLNCIIEGCKTINRYWHYITITITGAIVRVCTRSLLI